MGVARETCPPIPCSKLHKQARSEQVGLNPAPRLQLRQRLLLLRSGEPVLTGAGHKADLPAEPVLQISLCGQHLLTGVCHLLRPWLEVSQQPTLSLAPRQLLRGCSRLSAASVPAGLDGAGGSRADPHSGGAHGVGQDLGHVGGLAVGPPATASIHASAAGLSAAVEDPH